MTRTWDWRIALGLALVLALSSTASGQVRRGEIGGTVTDNTGGTLPGVTVTVTGPALQVPSIVRVSNERGEYLVPDLGPGTYRVSYQLSGFATLVREGIILTTGFAARVDIQMQVAALAETITVAGASPVVDVTTTRGGATVSDDLIAAIPGNNNFRDVMLMVGGMQAAQPPRTGNLSSASTNFSGIAYGSGTGQEAVEGLKRYSSSPPNMSAYEEVDVRTFGNTADVDAPGAIVQMVIKSGGNQFHGRYNDVYQRESFSSNNITPELRRQGIEDPDKVVYFNDFTGDFGGRIIRDKLWFYANTRVADNKYTATGFVANAGRDGVYQTGDEPPAFPTDRLRSGVIKVSYQPTPSHRFNGVYHDTNNHYFQYFNRYTPLESSARHNQLEREWKPFEWQATLSNRWLVNVLYGIARWKTYRLWNGPDGPVNVARGGWPLGTPATFDRETQQRGGPAWDTNVLATSQQPIHQVHGRVNYLPEGTFLGTHNLQGGGMLYGGDTFRAFPGGIVDGCKAGKEVCPANAGIGEYRLIYDRIGGLPHQGTEIDIKNFPVTGSVSKKMYAAYFMDSWRPSSRLTFNLGLRWEHKYNSVPAQSKDPVTPVGFVQPVGEPFQRPAQNAGEWNVWAPRAATAYDLSGDGKTVAKASYGWFNEDLLIDYADQFGQNRPVTYTFRWNDLNRDGKYQPGEVNLALNGPDFLSVSGVVANVVNPDLRLPHTHEISTSIERELGQGLAVRGLFVYKRLVDDLQAVNVRRPLGVWTRAFTRRDPGPDDILNNANDGPLYTIYDYDPAYRGAAFVQNMNQNAAEDRQDNFKSYEVMLTKRQTGRWFANTSFLATKRHVFRTKVVATPNDNIFPVSDYWDVGYLLSGGYNFPHDIMVSTLYQLYNGLARQRTVQFRRADPAGGPSFPSTSTFTLPMEELGATRAPLRSLLNLRGSKGFKLHGSQRITVNVDAFNALNSSVPWGENRNTEGLGLAGVTDVSGPAYGNHLIVVEPRSMRLGLTYEF